MLLFSVFALAMLPANVKVSIGWFSGCFASVANFLAMAYSTFAMHPTNIKANMKQISLVFFLRYAFLIGWSVLSLMVFKVHIFSYCVGLLTVQIAVFLHQVYILLKNGKLKQFFRGEDE